MTNDVLKTRNSLMIITAVLGIICIAVGFIFAESIIMWAAGIALGVLICIFRVLSMTRSLEKVAEMNPENAKNYARAQYMLRYVITLAVAVFACYKGFADPIALIIGIVLLQPAVFIYNFMINRAEKNNRHLWK